MSSNVASVTQQLKQYSINVPTLPLSIWDTRGWAKRTTPTNKDNSEEDYATGELNYLLDGNLTAGMDLDSTITLDSPAFRQSSTYSQRMHIVMYGKILFFNLNN